jgi:hypothetical protein
MKPAAALTNGDATNHTIIEDDSQRIWQAADVNSRRQTAAIDYCNSPFE